MTTIIGEPTDLELMKELESKGLTLYTAEVIAGLTLVLPENPIYLKDKIEAQPILKIQGGEPKGDYHYFTEVGNGELHYVYEGNVLYPLGSHRVS